nr:MAG TPA: hypothetical protein [Caudoviricetes sp.]
MLIASYSLSLSFQSSPILTIKSDNLLYSIKFLLIAVLLTKFSFFP